MLQQILQDTHDKLEQTITHLKGDLATLRTGQATPALVESLTVSAYETTMELKELAAISAPEPTTVVIQPWDENIVENIEKALAESDLGVNPAVEGTTIRVPVPQLSEERRQEILKTIGEKAEAARIAVRNIRQEKIKASDNLCDEGKISEDEHETFKGEVQDLVDQYNQRIGELRKAKEVEIIS